MTEYELLLAIAQDQSEEEQKEILKQLTNAIEKAKGEVAQNDNWGKKTLAFPIKKYENAFYWLLSLKGEEKLPKIIADNLKTNDKVLRYLISKKEIVKKSRKKDSRKIKKTAETLIIR